MFTVLMVCTGNTCRSPMAEGILKSMVSSEVTGGNGDPVELSIAVGSAGIGTKDDYPASAGAVAACQAMGIDISAHGSQRLRPELLTGADLILTMEESHRRAVVAMQPSGEGRVFTLSAFADQAQAGDVPDPIGGDEGIYQQVAELIATLVQHAWPKIKELAAGPA